MNYEGRRIGVVNFGKELRMITRARGVEIGTFGACNFGKNGRRLAPGSGKAKRTIWSLRSVTERHSGRAQASPEFREELHVITLLEWVKTGTFGVRSFGRNGGARRLVLGAVGFLFGAG